MNGYCLVVENLTFHRYRPFINLSNYHNIIILCYWFSAFSLMTWLFYLKMWPTRRGIFPLLYFYPTWFFIDLWVLGFNIGLSRSSISSNHMWTWSICFYFVRLGVTTRPLWLQLRYYFSDIVNWTATRHHVNYFHFEIHCGVKQIINKIFE